MSFQHELQLEKSDEIPSNKNVKNSCFLNNTTIEKSSENIKRLENLQNESRIIEKSSKIIYLQNIFNCKLSFPFSAELVHLNNIKNSTLLFFPVKNSILMNNCQNLKLAAAAQQIRVHDSNDLSLFVHSQTAIIIENCTNINLAPYRISELSNVENNPFKTKICGCLKSYSNLSSSWNECVEVNDFDNLIGNSPNWSKMNPANWIEFSLLNLEI